jgi:hypothetical protein
MLPLLDSAQLRPVPYFLDLSLKRRDPLPLLVPGEFRISGFRIQDSGFQDSGFRIQDSGFCASIRTCCLRIRGSVCGVRRRILIT